MSLLSKVETSRPLGFARMSSICYGTVHTAKGIRLENVKRIWTLIPKETDETKIQNFERFDETLMSDI